MSTIVSAVLLAALAVQPVSAAIFSPVSQSRSVQLSAQLNAFNFETQTNSSAVFDDEDNSLPDGWDPLRMGMDIGLAEPDCFGQGLASQDLMAGSSRIEFSGLADVSISGYSPAPYMLEGSGGALVRMQYRFSLAQAQQVELVMDSSVGSERDDDFTFLLASAQGAPVWAATSVIDDEGLSRSFKRSFTLQAGDYIVSTRLAAASYLSGGQSSSGRTMAQFSLTAVPEPQTWVLVLAALGLVPYVSRKSLRQ